MSLYLYPVLHPDPRQPKRFKLGSGGRDRLRHARHFRDGWYADHARFEPFVTAPSVLEDELRRRLVNAGYRLAPIPHARRSREIQSMNGKTWAELVADVKALLIKMGVLL